MKNIGKTYKEKTEQDDIFTEKRTGLKTPDFLQSGSFSFVHFDD